MCTTKVAILIISYNRNNLDHPRSLGFHRNRVEGVWFWVRGWKDCVRTISWGQKTDCVKFACTWELWRHLNWEVVVLNRQRWVSQNFHRFERGTRSLFNGEHLAGQSSASTRVPPVCADGRATGSVVLNRAGNWTHVDCEWKALTTVFSSLEEKRPHCDCGGALSVPPPTGIIMAHYLTRILRVKDTVKAVFGYPWMMYRIHVRSAPAA